MGQDQPPQATTERRTALAALTVILLLLAIGANIYLGLLWFEVQTAGPANVDSLCNVNEAVNCVSVAASRYATFLGVPVALYAGEYYALALGLTLLSLLGIWRVRAWASVAFIAMLVALPFSILMAYLSITEIKSICLFCTAVYTINVLLLIVLAVAYRKNFAELLREGPKQLAGAIASPSGGVGIVVIGAILAAQIYFIPRAIGGETPPQPPDKHADAFEGLERNGLSLGPRDAPVQIVEFSDFECPACKALHGMLLRVVLKHKGKILWQHRDYPLDQSCNRKIDRSFHDHACQAARYARCAAEQNKFWEYGAMLFANQPRLARSRLKAYAKSLQLDLAKLDACVKKVDIRQAISDDIEAGIEKGINGTPTIFINGRQPVSKTHEWFNSEAWWDKKIAQITGETKGDK